VTLDETGSVVGVEILKPCPGLDRRSDGGVDLPAKSFDRLVQIQAVGLYQGRWTIRPTSTKSSSRAFRRLGTASDVGCGSQSILL